MTFWTNLGIYSGLIALAILVGGILPITRQWKRENLPLILSFAAGLMLGSAFFHLIPEGYEIVGKDVGYYILGGFLFLFLIERFITVHICEIFDCEVHKLGISAFIGIAIHTLTDGIALGSGLMVSGLGLVVFLAVVAHKAPEVFSLTTVLLNSQAKKSKIVLVNLCILLMIPLGATLAYLILKPESTPWIGRAIAFSAGTFLHISLSDLLPEAHRQSSSKVLSSLLLILGLAFMGLLENKLSFH